MHANYPYTDDELISALHKTIRANDIARSSFFAKIIKEKIGVWRVKQYLFSIVLEETLSIDLYDEGMRLFLKDDDEIKDEDIYIFIYKFCNTKKKWDYPQGQKFFYDVIKAEISFFKQLKEEVIFNIYNHDFNPNQLQFFESMVKKSSISYNQKSKTHKKTYLYSYSELLYLLNYYLNKKDLNNILKLSYLFFMNNDNLDFNLLSYFFKDNKLYNYMLKLEGKYANIFIYSALFYSLIVDLEDYYIDKVNNNFIELLKFRINKAIKEKRFLEIPLMALDRHTRRGKEDLAFIDIQYNKTLNKKADLRYSGLWYGIFWRIESIKHHNKILDKWEDVYVDNKYDKLWREHDFYKKSFKALDLQKQSNQEFKNITFEFGDLLDIEDGIIIHQVNCQKVMDSGLALSIKNKYPSVYKDYISMFDYFSKKELLGKVIYTKIDNLLIASTYTQYSYGKNGLYTDYKALIEALKDLNIKSNKENKTLYFPYKYASGLAGGNWFAISQLINKYCDNYKIIKLN